jgi:hypothetical protein
MCAWGTRRGRCVNRGCPTARVVTQRRNRSKQLTAVPERRYAKLLEVLRREVRQDSLVYLASYFPRPRLRSQTTMSMTAPHNQGVVCIIVWGSESVQGLR